MGTHVVYGGRVYTALERESVLETLLRGGAEVRYSCRKGSCQTCLLRVVEGDPGGASQRGLNESLVASGHFKPCVAYPRVDLHVVRPDFRHLQQCARVAERKDLGGGLVCLRLELSVTHAWRPGQRLTLVDPAGATEDVWISSLHEEDYYLDVLLDTTLDRGVLTWFADPERGGDELTVRGPFGEGAWRPELSESRVLLWSDEGAAGAALATLRGALRMGHQQPFTVHIALSADKQGWVRQVQHQAEQISASHALVQTTHASDDLPGAIAASLHPFLAVGHGQDPNTLRLIVLGAPDFVETCRVQAQGLGLDRRLVRAIPTLCEPPAVPKDEAKMASLPPDQEMWQALGEGRVLRSLLERFYTEVYADERLAPFFHRVTKERAIDKQYAFLKDIFSGSREYFGLRPYNGHHWMVISDDLFDYREVLFEKHLRAIAFPEHLIHRWLAMHERFRADIVKSKGRGLYYDGREHLVEGYAQETLAIGSLCDGCAAEMPEGSVGTLHRRTGLLYCDACSSSQVALPQEH